MASLDYLQLAKDNVERVYYNLETLCICFPGRISGSENLEKALDFLSEYGQDNFPSGCCQSESVCCVPCWTRGDWRQETCVINIIPSASAKPTPFPLQRQMRVLANGLSVGTGSNGVTGEIVIIRSWEELTAVGDGGNLKGKIVLYDYGNWIHYGAHASFRGKGAHEAAKYGAVAVLIRTMAPNSTTSGPHTGSQLPYDTTGAIPSIPAACLSVEDTELISRLAKRGHQFTATLTLPCSQGPDRFSRNIIFEIKGSELPDEVVIIGGHTDCWDCQHASCQGAHDDGQGVIISMEIIRILLATGVKPKRTIRAVLFVDEEVRQSGAVAYANAHEAEASKIVAAIETDLGVGPVCGFGYSGTEEARQQLREMLKPLGSLGNVTNVDASWSGNGVDISPLIDRFKVPGLLLRHEDSWWNEDYFHLHHTASDTIDHVDIDKLQMNLAVLLGVVWILANSEQTLPR